MKRLEELLKCYYTNPVIITTDRGNRGYFIKTDDIVKFHFIHKKDILNMLNRDYCYRYMNERKRKLLMLQIINDNLNI